MEEDKKYQKVDLQAVMDVVHMASRWLQDADVCQRANGIYIYSNAFHVEINVLIAISLQLYGRHDKMEAGCCVEKDYRLEISGAIYDLLPKYYVEGETVNSKERILKAITE